MNQAQPSTDVADSSATPPDSRRPARRTTRPSCANCKQRKIKCNRLDPCSHCTRVRVACVYPLPSGAPRGRQGGRRRKIDRELLDRIARLENLVKNIDGEESPALQSVGDRLSNGASNTSLTKSKSTRGAPKASAEGFDRYLGSSLWLTLSDEIHGMRDVLDQSSDEEDDGDTTPDSKTPASDFIISAPEIPSNLDDNLGYPTVAQAHFLYSSFMANVHPVVNMLHGPSLRRFAVERTGMLECSPGPHGLEALQWAIFYTAVTSLAPETCLQELKLNKAVVLKKFRSETETAMARADFVNTEEMSMLQALVFYLFAIRSNENSRRSWTLTSLAVRIAFAIGLHREKQVGDQNYQSQPFEREMRRRTWWQIALLDRQAAADRGSDPIISAKSFNTHMPLNIQDEDLIPGNPNEVPARDGYTDTTFCRVCHEVSDVERRLNYVDLCDQPQHSSDVHDWTQRQKWVYDCQQQIESYTRDCDVNVPVQRYTKMVSEVIVVTLWLFVYRPLQRQPRSVDLTRLPHLSVLHLCVQVMEKSIGLATEPSAAPFHWITCIWVQWHPLAVMIAELCVQTEGPTVERAWGIVEFAFAEIARHVADSDRGRLWRPIKKLMNKARAIRKRHLERSASALNFGHAATPVYSQDQTMLLRDVQSPDAGITPTGWQSNSQDNVPGLMAHGQYQTTNIPPPGSNREMTDENNQTVYSNEMDQMAWTNWESFIDDFQFGGGLLSDTDVTAAESGFI